MAGTNYGVVGGKRVAGLGGLGEWVSGGRLTAGDGKVAGRAYPAPTGWRKGERVLAGRCAGVGWFRAISVGGGVLDAPRRGQDPSLRCKPVTGGDVKLRAGHARPLRGGGWLAGAGRKVRAAYMPPPTGRRIVLSVFRTNIIIYPKRCCPRLFLFLWCRVIIYYV